MKDNCEPTGFGAQLRDAGNRVMDGLAHEGKVVGDAMHRGVEKTESAMSSVGEKLVDFGGSMKQTLQQPNSIGCAATAVADGITGSGEYLKSRSLEEMSKDAVDVARRHPIPLICVGLGLGFLLGRSWVRS
jgi:hypothetical protein